MEQLALFGAGKTVTVEPRQPEPVAEEGSETTTVIPGQLAFGEEEAA
jgi:hypothetical protein